jgi:hypothetical protein
MPAGGGVPVTARVRGLAPSIYGTIYFYHTHEKVLLRMICGDAMHAMMLE